LLVTVGYRLCRALYIALVSPLNQVPGPWYAKFSNLRLKLAVISGRRLHYIHALHKQYGEVIRVAPNEVSVAEVAGFKKIHAISGGFRKAQWYVDLTDTPVRGVFNMIDPKAHAARRRLLARPFTKSHLRENWEGRMRVKTELAVKNMFREGRVAGKVDMLKWWTFMATDVATMLMFGEDFGMLELGKVS